MTIKEFKIAKQYAFFKQEDLLNLAKVVYFQKRTRQIPHEFTNLEFAAWLQNRLDKRRFVSKDRHEGSLLYKELILQYGQPLTDTIFENYLKEYPHAIQ